MSKRHMFPFLARRFGSNGGTMVQWSITATYLCILLCIIK